jgi:8-oxo-dGTP diphosphatase
MPHIETLARAVILHGEHLLVCRSVERGHRYLPGGHVEFGETAAGAVERELMEEAGLRIRVGRCVLIEEHAFRQNQKDKHELTIVFVASIAEGASGDPLPIVKSLEDGLAFEWMHRRELGATSFLPSTQAAWLEACADMLDSQATTTTFLSSWEDA